MIPPLDFGFLAMFAITPKHSFTNCACAYLFAISHHMILFTLQDNRKYYSVEYVQDEPRAQNLFIDITGHGRRHSQLNGHRLAMVCLS